MHGESCEPIGFRGGEFILAEETSELLPCRCGMKGHIVENTTYIRSMDKVHKCGSRFKVLKLNEEHMGIVNAALRDIWKVYEALILKVLEPLIIPVPGAASVLIDLIGDQKLRPEICCVNITGQVAVAKINPGIFINLSAVEL